MKRAQGKAEQRPAFVSGLIISGPGECEQRRFFDELIPALDVATGAVVHLSSIGDPVTSGDNFREHLVGRLLQTDFGTLSKTWASNLKRWRDPDVAVVDQHEAALAHYGIRRSDLPCIVFPLEDGSARVSAILRIPAELFTNTKCRTALTEFLLSELSANRFHEVMKFGEKPGRHRTTHPWVAHVESASKRLQMLATRYVPSTTRVAPSSVQRDEPTNPRINPVGRIVLHQRSRTISLDGRDHVVSHQAWLYIKTLAEFSPGWVKGSCIPGLKRPREARGRLPRPLQRLIEVGRGGHRMKIRAEVAP